MTISINHQTNSLITEGASQVITIQSNGALSIPIGTTAQRPSSPVAGMMRFNTDTGVPEFHNGTSWSSVAIGGSAIDDLLPFIIALS